MQNVKFLLTGKKDTEGGLGWRGLWAGSETEGDRWGDGARYHANRGGVEAGVEVRKDGERNRGREGLNRGTAPILC